MSWRIVGQLVTADGANVTTDVSRDPDDIWRPIRHRSWSIPGREVRPVQASEIPVRAYHGGPKLGRITHLERAEDGSVWCVADIDADITPDRDTDYYLSVEARFNDGAVGRDIEITGAALCERSRMIGLRRATLIRRDGLTHRGEAVGRLGAFQRELLERAATRTWQRGAPIRVHEPYRFAHLEGRSASDMEVRQALDEQHYRRPVGPLRHGRVVRNSVLSVR
jgi:hypothetical protein